MDTRQRTDPMDPAVPDPAAQAPSPRSFIGPEEAVETRVLVQLLDGFKLSCNGTNVPLPLASQRLVAFLALHGRPLLRLYVAGSLWLDAGEERSCANLRSALCRLRRPGRGVIEASATHVGLARTVVVDVNELVAAARRILD